MHQDIFTFSLLFAIAKVTNLKAIHSDAYFAPYQAETVCYSQSYKFESNSQPDS